MRQLVDQHEVALPDKGGDDAEIGEVPRAEDAGGLGVLPAGQPRLELGEERMVAGDEAGGAGADPIGLQRLDRRLLDRGVVAQVEIVIAAEREQPAAIAQGPDAGDPGGIDERPAQVDAGEIGELGGGEIIERTHSRSDLNGLNLRYSRHVFLARQNGDNGA